MNKYRIQHDFNKFQPRWNASYRQLFGERNEGALVEAESEREALTLFCEQRNLNPFYLKVIPA